MRNLEDRPLNEDERAQIAGVIRTCLALEQLCEQLHETTHLETLRLLPEVNDLKASCAEVAEAFSQLLLSSYTCVGAPQRRQQREMNDAPASSVPPEPRYITLDSEGRELSDRSSFPS